MLLEVRAELVCFLLYFYSATWQSAFKLKKRKKVHSFSSANLFLSDHPKNDQRCGPKGCPRTFIMVLFMTAKNWNQPNI